MAERTFLQKVVAEAVDLFDFVGEWLNEKSVRTAVIRDLGGDPNAAAGAEFPTAPMESIKAYRDAANPDAEAEAAVLADVLQIIDFITANIEVWAAERDVVAGVDQFVQSAIDLMATNYVRLRWPRFFLIMQAVTTLQEMTATYGAGSNSLVRLGTSLKTIGEFLFNPGRSLEQLQPNADPDLPSVFDNYGLNHRTVDGLFRLGATMLGWMHVNQKWKDITGDVLAGWDAPGLDIDSPDPPRAADIVSNQMVSFSFYPDDEEFEGESETAKPLLLSLAYVPALLPAQGLFVSFGGHLDKNIKVGDRWMFTSKIRSDAVVAVLLGVPPRARGPFDDANFAASVGFASRPDELTQLSFSIPKPVGSRLDIGQLSASTSLTGDGAEVKASMTDAALVLDGDDNDSFIRKLLGGKPMRLPFNVTIGYATGRGLILEGGLPSGDQSPGGQPSGTPQTPGPPGTAQRTALVGDSPVGGNTIDATIPIGRRFGPVTVLEVAFRLTRTATVPEGETDVYAVELGTSFSVMAGSVFFRVDRLGLGFVLDTSKPPAERNLRWFDARLAISPPLGIAVQVDTALVSGGGTIFHDPATGTYFGALALRLGTSFTLKAFGLVATKIDGKPASSFIIIGTLEGLGWQIGPVTVDGLGLLFASDRTFDENAVRAALPTGQLKYLLFPTDPVHNTTEIMRPLDTFFPAFQGSTLVGILVKLTFGRTQLVRLDLAFILQVGNAVSTRLIVLGRLSSVIPTESVRVVQLNLDAVGVFDFSAGTAALDAVLVDSKLCGRFPLTGAAAFRRVPGVSGFALAVGGFHPRFAAPPGFPTLPRVTVALTNGDNPKLVCQAYVAITSNTVQLGASASLYASACGFSLQGNIGFDVLIQLVPPHFLAEFRASVQLKRGSTNLFKISVEGALEGAFPLRVAGKATFEILWWDYSIGFDKTLIGGDSPVSIEPVDAQGEVILALADPRSWRSELPGTGDRMVVLRRDDRPEQILMHPMGTLQVQQSVAPLNLTRDIDRLGEARPSGARRFAVTSVTLGSVGQTTRPVREQFAPGQFFDLTDDERLAAPSFDEMEAGVAFGNDAYQFARSAVVRSAFDYEDITIQSDGTPRVETDVPLEGPLVLVLAGLGAAARARFRDPSTRFRTRPSPAAPVMRPRGYTVATVGDPEGPATPGPTTTWIEAHKALNLHGFGSGAVLVPAVQETVS